MTRPAHLSRGRRLAFGLAAALILLAATEVVLRLHDFGFYYNFGADLLGMPLLDLHRIRRVQNQTVEFDPELFWRFKPNQKLTDSSIYRRPVYINSHGFRGYDFETPKPDDTYRVICLGDSSTFGWSVGDTETYPAQLFPRLQRLCPRAAVDLKTRATYRRQRAPSADGLSIEVLNLGVTGYTSHQGRRLLDRVAEDLKPDLVIFAFGPNDRLPALKSDREHEADRTWDIGPVSLLLSRLQLYKLVKAAVIYAQSRSEGIDLDPKTYIPRLKRKVSPEEFTDNLLAVKSRCDQIGADLIVLNVQYPSLPADFIDGEIKKQAEAAGAALPADWRPWDQRATVIGGAAAIGVPAIDLETLFEQRLGALASGKVALSPAQKNIPGVDREPWRLLMVDNGHPNYWGHELIAERLTEIISDLPAFRQACGEKP